MVNLFFGKRSHPENPELIAFIQKQFSFKPKNLELYAKAFRHKSVAKQDESGYKASNERLEYLGDAVLGMIVAEILFEKYPTESEGFLTQMRSKIVSRNNLNYLGNKIGLTPFILFQKSNSTHKSLVGNVFEAFFGAIYKDKGLKTAQKVFKKYVFDPHINLDNLENNVVDFKSQLLIYCQKNKINLEYRLLEELKINGKLSFRMGLYMDGDLKTQKTALSKKSAEQLASQEVFEALDVVEE